MIGFIVRFKRGARGFFGLLLPGTSVSPAVRKLLEAQRVAAEDSAYRPGTAVQPLVGDIYVEQQAEPVGPAGLGVLTVLEVHEILRRDFPDAMVLGGPGTGKSTMAKHLVRESATSWLASGRLRRPDGNFHHAVVLRVPASGLARAAGDSIAEALHTFFQSEIESLPPDTFRRRVARGVKWMIIIDGTDELHSPTLRTRLLALIHAELSRSDRALRLIVTSRAPLETVLTDLTELRLKVFDKERLDLFARRWFTSRRSNDPAGNARRYLNRISTGPLGSLVRVPLMATMAAVIYESDSSARLPTSRTELYAQFIQVVRQSRAMDAVLANLSPSTVAWLGERLDDLLAAVAAHTVEHGSSGLMDVAAGFCATESPASVRSELTYGGCRPLRDVLLGTSLVGTDGITLSFIHHSIAEYLAAGSVRNLTAHVERLMDPDKRSLALFCVARAGRAARTVADLLTARPPDPLRAGYLLLDGVDLDRVTRQRVVLGLGGLLADESDCAGEVLTILTGLAIHDAAVAQMLFSWAGSSKASPWVRALAADKVADFDPDRGHRLLVSLAADRGPLRTHECRLWAARRLVSRGHPLGIYLLEGIEVWKAPASGDRAIGTARVQVAGGALVAIAYREIAVDPRQSLIVRAESALELTGDDPAVLEVLHNICLDPSAPADVRRKAAGSLCTRPGTAGVAAISKFLREPAVPEDTRAIAVRAIGRRTDELCGEIRTVLRDVRVSGTTKRAILNQMQWRGNAELSVEIVLDRTAAPVLRIEAARFLSTRGGVTEAMRVLCIDGSAPAEARIFAVTSLQSSAGRADLARLAQMATNRNEDKRLRYYAAMALRSCQDPTGNAVLRQLAETKHDDPWLATMIAKASGRSVPRARTSQEVLLPVGSSSALTARSAGTADGPVPPARRPPLTDNPAKLRRIVRSRTADTGRREAAAARLLELGPEFLWWLVDQAAPFRGHWLQDFLIAALTAGQNQDDIERCRILVTDDSVSIELRQRLAAYLVERGDPDDLSRIRPMVTEPSVDTRVREMLVESLLARREPEDVAALVKLVRSPIDSRLAKRAVEQLMAADEYDAVRRLWPTLWDDDCAESVRLTLGETLAYVGTRADLDELGRLVANAATGPYLRLRVAEILSLRGDALGREVLRILVCDRSADTRFRMLALARIATVREEADLRTIREVADSRDSPLDLRMAALSALAVVGATEFDRILEIGADPGNPAALREQAGRTLAQLGDERGLQVLEMLQPSSATPRVFRAILGRSD